MDRVFADGTTEEARATRPEPRGGDESAPAVAVAVARRAQACWEPTPLRERLTIVRRFRHLLAEHAPALAEAAGRAGGPRLAETLASEVLPLADACRFLEREAGRLLRPRRLGRRGLPAWLFGVEAEVRREPFGVVLVIGPSNYPLLLPGVQTIQALVAGNAVVWKPGAGGEPAARALAGLLVEAGLIPDLLRRLPESPEAARRAIAAGVDKVVLTGSAETGRAVLADLAPRLVPATVELSGCDAVFVRAEADLDLVARALAFGLRLNGGATCIGPRRVFVPRERAEELEHRLAALLRREATGAVPLPPSPLVGKDASARIDEALDAGARLVTCLLRDDGYAGPVVVAGARPDMRLVRADTFAPVLALVSVEDDDEALRAADSCPFALGAAIFGDPIEARRLAGRIKAGAVVINDLIVPTADPRLPFGGRRRSGFGVTRGAEGLLEMTAIKVVATRRGRFRPHYDPPVETDAELFRAYLAAAHGATIGRRLAAASSLLKRLRVREAHQ